jgi:hypothetical protein
MVQWGGWTVKSICSFSGLLRQLPPEACPAFLLIKLCAWSARNLGLFPTYSRGRHFSYIFSKLSGMF